ncbi:MAG: FMN-binding protein [Candidatus Omnitrophica bacterium]|nr:FMN-binding protein [Candidatus Omnitrophota bacterium]
MKKGLRIKIVVAILLSGAIFFAKGFCKQKETQELLTLRDGIYTGTSFKFPGPMKIRLTVKENKITDIRVTRHMALVKYTRVLEPLIQNIIATQNTKVDAISGATISSNALKKAVDNALAKATRNQNGE